MCGGGPGDGGSESTLFFSGLPSRAGGSSAPDVPDSVHAPLSEYYPHLCGNLVVGTVSGTPTPPACVGLRPSYTFAVVLDASAGDPALSRETVEKLEKSLDDARQRQQRDGQWDNAERRAQFGHAVSPTGFVSEEGGVGAGLRRLASPYCWTGVVDVRTRTALRQCGIVRAVASNGWSSIDSSVRTCDAGAYAVVGPIIGKVGPTSAVVLVEVDVRARVRCVLTDAFTGQR